MVHDQSRLPEARETWKKRFCRATPARLYFQKKTNYLSNAVDARQIAYELMINC